MVWPQGCRLLLELRAGALSEQEAPLQMLPQEQELLREGSSREQWILEHPEHPDLLPPLPFSTHLSSDTVNWVVLGQPEKTADKVLLDYKAPVAAFIMLLMVVLMMFDFIPVAPVTAVIIAGLLTVFTGCFRNVEAAYKTINWESIVLIAAMMPMSTALEKTGASALVSQTLVDSLGTVGPTALLAGIYFTTSFMTMFISNTATAVLMAPIAMEAAQQVGVSPYAFLFAVTLGASMCFASPFSTPPNALVMKAGGYTFMDYVKVGLPLQVIIGIVMTFVLPLLFPY